VSAVPTYRLKAKLHLLSTAEGGRRAAIRKIVYRPQFHLGSICASCRIDAIEDDTILPGGEGGLAMTLLHPERFGKELRRGSRFEIREGSKIVGWGIIDEVEADDRRRQTGQAVLQKVTQS
jgi:translation elongation factor EF-Tu-like GTPase